MIRFSPKLSSSPFRFWLAVMIAGVQLIALVSCNTPPAPTPTASVLTSVAITPVAKPPVPAATVTPTQLPAVSGPGGLTAESSDTVIKLKWSAVSGTTGYFIFRDDNEQPLNPKPLTETNYDDIGLTNGRTYTYTLAVADSSGKPGPQSATITAVPTSK